MPELPEVEVLVRHLAPRIRGRKIAEVHVRRPKILGPTSPDEIKRTLRGATFVSLRRRGKYLVFDLRAARRGRRVRLIGHLGMTGRMYLLPAEAPWPKHAAVVLNIGRQNFVFEDTRYFGKFTLDTDVIARLGPEPLCGEFSVRYLRAALQRSMQPIKVKLLDQRVVAGIGNIYASEALFRAGIPPRKAARRLSPAQLARLHQAVRDVLTDAIDCGSTVPLNYAGPARRDGLFYFGRAPGAPDYYEERLRVYDRAGKPCPNCGTRIKRFVQAARSTYYCSRCQRG